MTIEYHDATTTEGAREALVSNLLDSYLGVAMRAGMVATFDGVVEFAARGLAEVLTQAVDGEPSLAASALGGDEVPVAHRECIGEVIRSLGRRGYSPSKLERITIAKDEE